MGGDHRSAAIEAQADTILSLLAEQPDATLVEYQESLAKTGHRFSCRRSGGFLTGAN
jgi:cystathionine beta-lyase/cystathionine gamma-synthase